MSTVCAVVIHRRSLCWPIWQTSPCEHIELVSDVRGFDNTLGVEPETCEDVLGLKTRFPMNGTSLFLQLIL